MVPADSSPRRSTLYLPEHNAIVWRLELKASKQEAVGARFELKKMQDARERTFEVINEIGARVHAGMLESEANALCLDLLHAKKMDRIWHPILVRFGANTLKTFKQRSDGDPRLQENDLFFCGPWRGLGRSRGRRGGIVCDWRRY